MKEELLRRFNDDAKAYETFDYDSWGSAERAELFRLLEDKELVSVDYKLYSVHYTHQGGCGMGAYPARVTVHHIVPSNAEALDGKV